MVYLTLFLFYLLNTQPAPYCTVGRGLFNAGSSANCFSSDSHNITNCCYGCDVSNTSGSFFLCGSLYELDGFSCGNNAALDRAKNKCAEFGGPNVACVSNLGLDQSQFIAGQQFIANGGNTPIPTNSDLKISTCLNMFLLVLFISLIL